MYLRSPWHRSLLYLDDDEESSGAGGAAGSRRRIRTCRRAASVDLERALATLPPLTRSVVWLHDVEGYTHAEIARLLGRTASFSKSQLARAHARLRELLEQPAGVIAMHARIEHLLSLRDGEPVDGGGGRARRAVPDCSGELQRLSATARAIAVVCRNSSRRQLRGSASARDSATEHGSRRTRKVGLGRRQPRACLVDVMIDPRSW